MKQTKINSFIKFMGKINNASRQKEEIVMEGTTFNKCSLQRKLHCNTIGMNEQNNKTHAIILHKTNQCIIEKCSADFIIHQDKNIKHRYDDKKSLYEAYRNSLQKKKEQLQLANNKFINKLNKIQQSQSFQKQQASFPINKTNKIKQSKPNYAYQKIFSNRSISINPYQSKGRLNTQKFHANHKTEFFNKKEQEYLREKKLDYKPIFRVKRVHLLESYRTETAPPTKQTSQVLKIKKQNNSLIDKLKIKTQPIQDFSKIISFRDRIANRNKGSINTIQRFEGWDYDEMQQTSRIFC